MRTMPLRLKVAGLAAFMLVLLVGSLPAQAAAGDPVLVAPGETRVLVTSDKPIVPDKALPTGAAIYAGTAPQSSLLVFTPAKDAAPGAVTEIAYKIGDTAFVVRAAVAQPYNNPQMVVEAGRILFAMLVLALILEIGLSVLFNWRVFLEFFDGRGTRTVIMFAAAWIFVVAFHQDFVASLLQVYTANAGFAGGVETQILSALVLAGGSATVNRLMVGLGIRENKTVEQVVQKPPATKAWISVTVKRPAGDEDWLTGGDFRVLQASLPSSLVPETLPALVGVIQSRNLLVRLSQYFWRSTRRLPMSGGREVEIDRAYAFVVEAKFGSASPIHVDVSGNLLERQSDGSFVPQPTSFRFAEGAIVDFIVPLPSNQKK